MKNEWYNNVISKKLHEEYPRDFSICDIDGVCRKKYMEEGIWKTRLVIYESKWEREGISQTQLETLHILDSTINWEKLDKYSGVFLIIVLNEDLKNLIINKIIHVGNKYVLKKIKDMTFENFYNWISGKDK